MLSQMQKAVLFYVVIISFCAITALTIWGVFFGLDNFEPTYKKALFGSLILEIVGAVIVLFRSGFSNQADRVTAKKIWIDLGDEHDVKKYIGKDVSISARGEDGNPLGEDIVNSIQNDRGLYVTPELPNGTTSVMIALESDGQIFEGSFSSQSYSIKLEGELA
jgi:hypothetical protein